MYFNHLLYSKSAYDNATINRALVGTNNAEKPNIVINIMNTKLKLEANPEIKYGDNEYAV